MNKHDMIVPVTICDHCLHYVTAEAAEALACPACLLLDEYGTVDIPFDMTLRMSSREQRLVAATLQSIPHYYNDKEQES